VTGISNWRCLRLLATAISLVSLAGGAHAEPAPPEADVILDRPILVVTATPPLDAERLADALRAYLDEFRVDVQTAPAAPGGDLRDELAATAGIGAAVRAWAVVRIADGAPGSAELELVDRVTGKSLVTNVPRPRRDEDLYRAVALKTQALLRATLAEPSPRVTGSPVLTRLAAPSAPAPAEVDRRFFLETSFALVAFPGARVLQQGLAVSLAGRLGATVEVALGTQALSRIDAQAGAVDASVSRVPLWLAARMTARRGRWEGAAGVIAEAALVSIETSSPTLATRSGWSVAPALGGQLGGGLRLGGRTWIGARASALGVILGQHFTAQGQPLVSLWGLQLGVEGGVAVDLW
jgi:hypothetical protein